MPRVVRGLGESRRSQRTLLQQQSYNFDEHPSVVESRAPSKTTLDADSLIRTCEAWACEAFRLPGDFLHTLAQPAKKKRQVVYEYDYEVALLLLYSRYQVLHIYLYIVSYRYQLSGQKIRGFCSCHHLILSCCCAGVGVCVWCVSHACSMTPACPEEAQQEKNIPGTWHQV